MPPGKLASAKPAGTAGGFGDEESRGRRRMVETGTDTKVEAIIASNGAWGSEARRREGLETPEPTVSPSSAASSAVALVEAYLEGDAAALDHLFRRNSLKIRSVCMRYVHDETLAEDLVQETFFNVTRSLNRVGEGF